MVKKQPVKKKGEQHLPVGYSDAELVGFCGINCKICRAKGQQREQLAGKLKESLQELPLDLFSQILPPFKNIKQVMEFLDFLPHMGGQTCCTDDASPCGDPSCGIRACVKTKEFKTCAECSDYRTCAKLDFLKPFHASLITDLDSIKERGLEQYVTDVISKSKLDQITIR